MGLELWKAQRAAYPRHQLELPTVCSKRMPLQGGLNRSILTPEGQLIALNVRGFRVYRANFVTLLINIIKDCKRS